jgi:galactose-1-phosphate uridylyltransferase
MEHYKNGTIEHYKNGTIQIGLVAAFRNWLQTIGCFVIHWITAFTVGGKK